METLYVHQIRRLRQVNVDNNVFVDKVQPMAKKRRYFRSFLESVKTQVNRG